MMLSNTKNHQPQPIHLTPPLAEPLKYSEGSMAIQVSLNTKNRNFNSKVLLQPYKGNRLILVVLMRMSVEQINRRDCDLVMSDGILIPQNRGIDLFRSLVTCCWPLQVSWSYLFPVNFSLKCSEGAYLLNEVLIDIATTSVRFLKLVFSRLQ